MLHQRYAKRERIDSRAPVTAAHEVEIHAPVQRVWDLLADPMAWPSSAPEVHGVHLTWTGVSSGFKAVHRHLLEATGDGATRVRSEESMAGPLLVLFYGSAKLQAGIEAWLAGLKRAAERQ